MSSDKSINDRLEEIRNELSADRYYSLDYDLRDAYIPASMDDVLEYLLKRDKDLRDVEVEMSMGIIKILDFEAWKDRHKSDKVTDI